MTTIVYRDGVLASDSQVTAGDARKFHCEKLYRVEVQGLPAIVGLAGGAFDGLAFLDWLVGEQDAPPQRLIDGEADFTAVVLNKHGLFEYDKWCRPDKVLERFYAVGSGASAALGAMHMGATAREAVAVACKIDPYSGGPIVEMSLPTARKRTKRNGK